MLIDCPSSRQSDPRPPVCSQSTPDCLMSAHTAPIVAVAEGLTAGIGGRGVPARWVTTLVEPLMPPADRTAHEQAMVEQIRRDPAWAAAYFAGFLHEIVVTLPADDPWRNLPAMVDLEMLATGASTPDSDDRFYHRVPGQPMAPATGAFRPDGSPFGTIDDAADLALPGMGGGDDPSVDVGLAALADGLSPLSAALLGFAPDTGRYLRDVFDAVYHAMWKAYVRQSEHKRAAEQYLATVSAALRWAIHRRRVYTGPGDEYPVVLGYAWISKAERVTMGAPMDPEFDYSPGALIDPAACRVARLEVEEMGQHGDDANY